MGPPYYYSKSDSYPASKITRENTNLGAWFEAARYIDQARQANDVKIKESGLSLFLFFFLIFILFFIYFSIFRTTRVRVDQSCCHISHNLIV